MKTLTTTEIERVAGGLAGGDLFVAPLQPVGPLLGGPVIVCELPEGPGVQLTGVDAPASPFDAAREAARS